MNRTNKTRVWLGGAIALFIAFILYTFTDLGPNSRSDFSPNFVSYDTYGEMKKGQDISTLVRIMGEPVDSYVTDDSTLVYLYPMGGPAPDHIHVYLKNKKIDRIGFSL